MSSSELRKNSNSVRKNSGRKSSAASNGISSRRKLSLPELIQNSPRRESFAESVEKIAGLKKRIHNIVVDYFYSFSLNDFASRIKELEMESDFEQIPKIIMSLSFDRNDKERKAAADLIIHLVSTNIISPENLSKGFRILLNRLTDLILDCPNVVSHLEFFVKRFIDNKVMLYGHSTKFMNLLSIFSGAKIRKTVKIIVEKVFDTYFLSRQLEECCKEIEELSDESLHPLIIKYCISFSMDRSGPERELVSQFLAKVEDEESSQSNFIKRKSLENGFMLLLSSLLELIRDVPRAHEYLAAFIARAIYDESLAPSFIKRSLPIVEGDAQIVLKKADLLLSHSVGSNELANIWGSNLENVDELKDEVRRLVKNFFDLNGNADEFRHELLEIKHPHFHYEVVFQLFSTLLDRDIAFLEKTAGLISSLYRLGICSAEEIAKGFNKAVSRMEQLSIDVPNAKEVYAELRKKVLENEEFKKNQIGKK